MWPIQPVEERGCVRQRQPQHAARHPKLLRLSFATAALLAAPHARASKTAQFQVANSRKTGSFVMNPSSG